MIQRTLISILHSPTHRVLRQRLLVSALSVLTVLVVIARLDAEAEFRLEANTVVLQDGFPAIPLSNDSLSVLHLQRSPLPKSTTPVVVTDLRMAEMVNAQKWKWLKTSYEPPLENKSLTSRTSRFPLGGREPTCGRLISGDTKELARAKDFMDRHKRLEKTPQEYLVGTRNCSQFIQDRGYIMDATEEEREFPIAYSIMMYTGVEQAERLLRAIYRPHNYHCIHVDLKAGEEIMSAVRAIAGCLPNVFIASRLNKVYWATYSSLEALIFCMDDLWKASATWKYYINLTGQEFPLKTNLQLVRILRALNESNIVDASTDPSMTSRWYNNYAPPHGITPYKGMVFILACRGFVDYILHNRVAKDILEWVKYTDMPDETYFPSLNHNPHLMAPGSYRGPADTNPATKPYLARYVNWNTNWRDGEGHYIFRFPCYGKRVRDICIFGVGDLPSLTNRKEVFANKFHWDFEPLALRCMEEWLLNMTIAEYSGKIVLNTTYYANLDIVKNKVI